VEEMGENITNSRTISTKLNRIFSWLLMYQGMMTFVLMTKEPGPGLCFSHTAKARASLGGVAVPAAGTAPGSTHAPRAHPGLGFYSSSDSSNAVLSYTGEAPERADRLVPRQRTRQGTSCQSQAKSQGAIKGSDSLDAGAIPRGHEH